MTVYDDKGRAHPDVGTGANFWARRTNQYVGCTCPATRYDPTKDRPTSPDCQTHGTVTSD